MVKRQPGKPGGHAEALADLWRRQCAGPYQDWFAPEVRRPERGWLLDAGVADVLGPFARLSDDDNPITIVGVDAAAAHALLDRFPATALDIRQNWAPALRDLLTVIAAHPGVVSGTGYIVGPDRCDERLSLDGLLIEDPGLFDFAPDVHLGPVPAMVSELGPEQQDEYHEHHFGCVAASVPRQQWYAARHRYRIHGADAEPTEIEERTTASGDRALWLWWT